MTGNGSAGHPVIEYRELQKKFADLSITFSVFRTVSQDEGSWLVTDQTGEVPVAGKVVFVYGDDADWGNGRNYRSEVMTSPSLAQIARLADQAIKKTGDRHHRFFEGVRVIGKENDTTVARLIYGS